MTTQAVQEFDCFADNYRRIHTENVRISGADSAYFARHKLEQIRREEGEPIIDFLDFGCGDGILATFFSELFPGSRYTGFDISAESIRVASCRNLCSCRFVTGEPFGMLPFEPQSFDVVLVSCVFHHIPDSQWPETVKRLIRVMRPNGRLYIFEHNPLNPVTRYIVSTCVFDRNAVLVWPKPMIHLLRASGLEPHSERYVLFFPRIRPLRPLLPLEPRLAWLPIGAQYYIRADRNQDRFESSCAR